MCYFCLLSWIEGKYFGEVVMVGEVWVYFELESFIEYFVNEVNVQG